MVLEENQLKTIKYLKNMAYNKSLADKFLRNPDGYSKEQVPQNEQFSYSSTNKSNSAREQPFSEAKSDTSKTDNQAIFIMILIGCFILGVFMFKGMSKKKETAETGNEAKNEEEPDSKKKRNDGAKPDYADSFFQSPTFKIGKKAGQVMLVIAIIALMLMTIALMIRQVKNVQNAAAGL
jgi:cbb3-type cytochrome oxidase subunit 3